MTEVLVDGLTLRGSSEAHDRYLGAVCRGEKEPFTAELFADSVQEGATVVDGGAYIGFYTLLAARRVGADGLVAAFEPNPAMFGALCDNVVENGFQDRVIALPLGLSGESGRRPFYIGEGDASKSSLFVPEEWKHATDAECTTLDDALGSRALDLMKLDIEGGEVDVLRGMRDTLAASPDPRLIVECNPGALSRAGTSARTLLRELERAGFELAMIDDERRELRDAGDAVAIDGHVNLYCRRS